MDDNCQFDKERTARIKAIGENNLLWQSAQDFLQQSIAAQYSYNFTWLGRPIIQYPQDIIALQEIISLIEPDLIIESGIAHGGSLIFSASQLALLDLCAALNRGDNHLNLTNIKRKVLAIDIDIRPHNRTALEAHPLAKYITMIEGSSIEPTVVEQVYEIARNYQKIMLIFDSNHSHLHVLAELRAYAELCSLSSYVVVFDTIIEDLAKHLIGDRPWGKGNSPQSAIAEFLASNDNFIIDQQISNKLVISVANGGYLLRVK